MPTPHHTIDFLNHQLPGLASSTETWKMKELADALIEGITNAGHNLDAHSPSSDAIEMLMNNNYIGTLYELRERVRAVKEGRRRLTPISAPKLDGAALRITDEVFDFGEFRDLTADDLTTEGMAQRLVTDASFRKLLTSPCPASIDLLVPLDEVRWSLTVTHTPR